MTTHPYESFLTRVSRPARYLGGEFGPRTVSPAPDALRVLLGFPDAYEVGMSHQGLHILLAVLGAEAGLVVDRVFAPWPDLEAELRARGLPLVSLDRAEPVATFDLVGLSLQHELTYTNVLTVLDLGGVPLRAAARGARDPIVLGGGPCASHPEPIAPFFDAFLVGEGEEALPAITRCLAAAKRAGATRSEKLQRLAALPGVYVPACYDRVVDAASGRLVVAGVRPGCTAALPVVRQWLPSLVGHPFPGGTLVPSVQAIFDRVSVEIARGCPQGCRFCQAGFLYRPARERPPDSVVASIHTALRACGFDEVSLGALSAADYGPIAPLIERLMDSLAPERVALSVSSLRAYGLPRELLDRIAAVRKTGLTLAPEAGTQRLRDVINKHITEDDLRLAAENAAELGWLRIKLYFMIGLPSETDDDVRAIAGTAERVLAAARRKARAPRRFELTVAVSTHVPKPHGPFQWAPMADDAEIERKQRLLRGALGRGATLKVHDRRLSLLEGVLSRGDARLADAIEAAWRAGARFDGWDDQFKETPWQQAFAATATDTRAYLGALPVGGRLPWDHCATGVAAAFLENEYHKALRAEPTPPCARPEERHCRRCGLRCDAAPADGASAEPAPADVGGGPPAAPALEPLTREAAWQVRLRFAKRGRARFLSQLDLVRHLPRILRRAGLRLGYSTGHHPKPLQSLAPALPLGFESLAELLEVYIAPSGDPAALPERLNAVAFPGLTFEAARLCAPNEPRLMRTIHLAAYLLRPPDAAVPCPAAAELLPAVVTALGERGAALHWLGRVELPAELRDALAHPAREALLFVHDLRPGLALRASDIAALVWPAGTAEGVHVVRVGLWRVLPSGDVAESLDGAPVRFPFAGLPLRAAPVVAGADAGDEAASAPAAVDEPPEPPGGAAANESGQ